MLLDLRLPGMDGLALTRKLRATAEYRDLTIIAVTASAMKGDEAVAIAAGCDAYVTKPVDTRSFPATVAAVLARREA
jgi:CheY-like chemotaxis protein